MKGFYGIFETKSPKTACANVFTKVGTVVYDEDVNRTLTC